MIYLSYRKEMTRVLLKKKEIMIHMRINTFLIIIGDEEELFLRNGRCFLLTISNYFSLAIILAILSNHEEFQHFVLFLFADDIGYLNLFYSITSYYFGVIDDYGVFELNSRISS